MPLRARKPKGPGWTRNVRGNGMVVVLEVRVVTESGGGPDKTILNSPRFLISAGYRTLCAYMHPPNDPGFEQLRLRAQASEAPLISVPDRGPLDWNVAVQLLSICRRERVTIWHGHDYKSNVLGLLLRRLWPMRLITTVHGWDKDTPRAQFYFTIDRLCLPYYDRVICVSEDLRGKCLAAGVPVERCVLIENAIDTVTYSRTKGTEDAKKALGFSPDCLLIGAIGRLSAEKGFDVLIRSVQQLFQAGLDVNLVIVGEGEERSRLEALSAELGCVNRVRLLGYRRNPLDVYEAMDVYALSSLHEGLPNVVLEALAMEVPVVATSVGGLPRLIRHEVSGLLVEAHSVDGLAKALSRLLTDSSLRLRCRRAGRALVESTYGFPARMQRIRGLYEELLGRRPSLSNSNGVEIAAVS
jgi:glycosyltransferase involved in cell wall biosynthesis